MTRLTANGALDPVGDAEQASVGGHLHTVDAPTADQAQLLSLSPIERSLWGSGQVIWQWRAGDDRLMATDFSTGVGELDSSVLADARGRIHPDDRLGALLAWNRHVFGGSQFYEAEYRYALPDSSVEGTPGWQWVVDRGRALARDQQGMALVVAGTRTPAANAAGQSPRNLTLLAKALDHTSDGMVVLDAEHLVLECNQALALILGMDKTELLGQRDPDCLRLSAGASGHPPAVGPHPMPNDAVLDGASPSLEPIVADVAHSGSGGDVWTRVDDQGRWQYETTHQRPNGQEVELLITVSVLRNEAGTVQHYVAVVTDITERKATENELRQLANFDALTGLANRAFVKERLRELVNQAERNSSRFAVLFIDLDRFKLVNDRHGHASGDMLLCAVSEKIKQCIRKTDLAGRWGGDEFVVLLDQVRSTDDGVRVAQKVRESVSEPLWVRDQEVSVGCCIGIAVFPEDGTTGHEILDHADMAMYRAKVDGRNEVQLYSPEMNSLVHDRLQFETALRAALDENDLDIALQPQVDLVTSQPVALEALLRWNSPQFGRLSAAGFLPLAEQFGLMPRFGEFVLTASARLLRSLQGTDLQGLKLAFNVGLSQLQDPHFVERSIAIVQAHNIAPSAIVIEISESTLVAHTDEMLAPLRALHAAGFVLGLDNFGAAGAALAALARLPFAQVKIDARLVRALAAGPGATESVASVPVAGTNDPEGDDNISLDMCGSLIELLVALGRRRGFEVIAEAVERDAELRQLRQLGCHQAQGYYFYKPIPADDVARELLRPRGFTARTVK